jgi:hypothetical protein
MTEAASTRDQHLFGPGPKRILALDGGGTKGIIELAFLARIEALLREHMGGGPDFRLCDWFDLIGGTSTGAIIAAALALGKPVAEITQLYLDLAPLAFRSRGWRVAGFVSRFDAKPLIRFLHTQFGARSLDSHDLKTGLAVIAHRFDTGSPWLISNNPHAPYWADPADASYIGNRHYKLTDVVRASTAAPGYFEPQKLSVVPGCKPALFVDGGLSPHNNPSLMLLMLAHAKTFGLCWPVGPENLSLISIGAGQYRRGYGMDKDPPRTAGLLAAHGLMQSLSSSQTQTLTMLQWISEPMMPWQINSEIGTLAGEVLGGHALLGFQRYDLLLEEAWLQTTLGVKVDAKKLARLRRLDGPDSMPELHAMATEAAARQVRLEHLTGGQPAIL